MKSFCRPKKEVDAAAALYNISLTDIMIADGQCMADALVLSTAHHCRVIYIDETTYKRIDGNR